MSGVNYAFEAAGREQTVQQAWSSLDMGGEAIVVRLMPHGATVPQRQQLRQRAGHPGLYRMAHLQRDVPALTGHYLAGDLLLDELIARRIGLDSSNSAFDALRVGKVPAASWFSTDWPPGSAARASGL